MNGYILESVKRIIVPKGLKEVTVIIGDHQVIVRADGTNDIRRNGQKGKGDPSFPRANNL